MASSERLSWPDRVRAQRAGTLTVVEPERAATVLLLRDAPASEAAPGPHVYLLRRRASMAFAAGMYAFPGGRVDPRDADPATDTGWSGPDATQWAERLGCGTAERARAIVCAAVRETFEESGVLLAGPDASTVVSDTEGPDWHADRMALLEHHTSLSELLARRRLVLRSDLLAAWARWITPAFEERRFDTYFFVASVPAGQYPQDLSGEADHTLWAAAADAVRAYDEGEAAMLPPTHTSLREVAAHRGGAARVLDAAERRPITPITPWAVLEESPDGEPRTTLEWDGPTPGRWSPSTLARRNDSPGQDPPGHRPASPAHPASPARTAPTRGEEHH